LPVRVGLLTRGDAARKTEALPAAGGLVATERVERTLAAAAVEDDLSSPAGEQWLGIEGREGIEAGLLDPLGGSLVGLAHVDDHGFAGGKPASGRGGIDLEGGFGGGGGGRGGHRTAPCERACGAGVVIGTKTRIAEWRRRGGASRRSDHGFRQGIRISDETAGNPDSIAQEKSAPCSR
jgi:hypothetical protein